MKIINFMQKKNNHEKISMVTCYDYTSARLLAQTTIDCLLVGDSVAMTMHGLKDTLSATIDMMCFHVSAVARGAGDKCIVGDLPFLSYRKSLSKNMEAAERLMQAGAQAVKLEGAQGNVAFIQHLVASGVPVMGHVGLTPQFIHMLGGYKVQGKTEASALRIKEDALALQDAGCFAVVLECVPTTLARDITQQLHIPTIGIGAGPDTDGQVLVLQDVLGLNIDFTPKFVKSFSRGREDFVAGINAFVNEVTARRFPDHAHCYGE